MYKINGNESVWNIKPHCILNTLTYYWLADFKYESSFLLFSTVCYTKLSKPSNRILSETREFEDSSEATCSPDPFG